MGRKRFYAGVVIASCALAFCGCTAPKEEDLSSVLAANNGTKSYELIQVERNTIRKTKVISANYEQVMSENLSFSVDGRRLAGVYVSLGDTVKKGDLLAELLCEEEQDYLGELEYAITTQEMQIEQLQEKKELDLVQLSRKKAEMPEAEYQAEVVRIEQECKRKTEDIEDQLYIERMQYDELYQWIEGCKIYAGLDGTITYMGELGSDYSSWSRGKVFTVSDDAECAFLCTEPSFVSYFTEGETYVFASSTGEEYETVLETKDAATGMMRFKLVEGRQSTVLGQRVMYSLVLEERQDVLNLPKDAVHFVDGDAYVYVFDSEGDRQAKKVSVGLQADMDVEIVSGLSEGDEVIWR